MEPKIEINVIGVDDPLIKRRLKRIAKPGLRVGHIRTCLLCQKETSWTVNNYPVCPLCQAKYSFIKRDYLPDACEVCNAQGEWLCGNKDQHSLCFHHRDAWFEWTRQPFLPHEYDKLPEDQYHVAWKKAFAAFIQEMKDKQYSYTKGRPECH